MRHLKVLKVLGYRDPSAESVLRVDSKAHVTASIDHCKARIVSADDFLILQSEAWLRLYLPLNPVLAIGETQIRRLLGSSVCVAGSP